MNITELHWTIRTTILFIVLNVNNFVGSCVYIGQYWASCLSSCSYPKPKLPSVTGEIQSLEGRRHSSLAFYGAMAPKSCRSIRYLLLSWNTRQRNLQSENRSAVNCHLFVESSSFRTNSILGIFKAQFLWFSFMITSQYTFPICLLKVCWYFAQCQFLSIQECQASARSCKREMPTSAAMAIKVFQWYPAATTKPFPITVFLTQRVFPKLGYPLLHYIYQRKNQACKGTSNFVLLHENLWMEPGVWQSRAAGRWIFATCSIRPDTQHHTP